MDKELKQHIENRTEADENQNEIDKDTIDFSRRSNIEMPFRSRVDAFWQWFLQNEAELFKMVNNRGEYDSDAVVEFITQGTNLISKDVHFNIGGDHEFTFSIEGNSYLFYLYPYLTSRMPEQLKGRWHFSPFNQGKDNSFDFRMYGVKVNMAEVYVSASYCEEQNDFSVSFYEKNLCSLLESQSCNAFYIMMEIMLGEGISYQYISDVKRMDKLAEGMTPLPELRRHITKTLNDYRKKVFDNPQKLFITYQLEPQENEELRYDVIIGSTCFHGLVSQYYQKDTELFDNINQFGARAVFIAFPYENNGADQGNEVLNFRYDLADRIEGEILKPEGLGLLLGGALGAGSCYVDFLLYDAHAFLEKVVPLLREYPQYSFYLSDFRQHCELTRLSKSEDDDC